MLLKPPNCSAIVAKEPRETNGKELYRNRISSLRLFCEITVKGNTLISMKLWEITFTTNDSFSIHPKSDEQPDVRASNVSRLAQRFTGEKRRPS